MNGKDLMESMGYVDEKYIAEAQESPKRRVHWQPLAAAACLVLVLAGAWRFLPTQSKQLAKESVTMDMAAGTARSNEMAVADQAVGPAVMMAPTPVQMTVQVVEQTEEGMLCLVVDPGTSDFRKDDQVTVVLPEDLLNAAAAQPAALSAEAPSFQVTFFPDQAGDRVTAQEWTRVEHD